ncbi:NEAT domain-containing protein [Clostridium sp.]|uniref:NEAT domain-containing protein n=1 Tax=Clostridium sp. TaxID=1506 RepID=UPI0026DA7EBD|nr:NEAT domain-containing protein [Clostridium sp.]MDO5040290.1 NEAT domain-containing protein [Clostridium sp.]
MNNKIIALLIAGSLSFSICVPASANNLNEIINDSEINKEDKLEDGVYKIENDAFHINEDKDSMARKFLEKQSSLRVLNGEIFVSVTFTNKSMMKNVNINVNDKDIEFKILDETKEKIAYEFKINSIKDKIIISSTPFTGMNVSFRFLLKEDTLNLEEQNENNPNEEKPSDAEKPGESEKPDNNEQEINKPNTENNKTESEENNVSKPNNESNLSTNKDEILNKELYKMQNEIITDSEIGYAAARGVISKTNYMEIRNGKKYITISISGTNLMSNIRVLINGKNINYNILKNDTSNNLMDIEFKIGSLNDNVKFKMHIDALGEDIEFGVKFLQNTVTQIGFLPESKPNTNLNIPSIDSVLDDSKDEKNSENNQSSETEKSKSNKEKMKTLAKESYKEYTIKNEIISDSSVGKKMARKYLNETALMEEVDGVKYITLRFSGMDLMSNIKIKINGEDVKLELVDEDTEKNIKAYRFKINSIKDEIKVYAYIIPMNMNIDFGVKLLEDTMTLVNEYKPEDVVINGEKLKKTLATTFGGGMFLLGAATSTLGGKLIKIRRRKFNIKENLKK